MKAKNDIGTADKCNYMCVAHQEAVVQHGGAAVAKKEKQGRNEDGSSEETISPSSIICVPP